MSEVDKLLANARQGRIADIARLLSIVENEEPEAAEIVRSTFVGQWPRDFSGTSRVRLAPARAL